jgi:glycosyltransferase involved in cell wall biosynthesis
LKATSLTSCCNGGGDMEIQLSILIPSVPERMTFLCGLVEELQRQTAGKPVEILVILENKHRTIGSKRNALIEQAQGQYLVFVDDDDRLDATYVDSLLSCIAANPGADCVVFDVAVYQNGGFDRVCKYGQEYEYGSDETYYYRKPNHLMCYAHRIAVNHKFQNISYGEDDEWAARVSQDIHVQVRIPQVLYYYDYISKSASWYERQV